jgi:hypothetical protein
MAFSEDLKALEQRLLDPALRADKAFLTRVLANDFQEIGQSGRVYDKASLVNRLPMDPGFSGTRTITDFEAREVGPGLVLAIYRIGETGTTRSSLWRRVTSEWELVFHQGTRPSQA